MIGRYEIGYGPKFIACGDRNSFFFHYLTKPKNNWKIKLNLLYNLGN